MYEILFAICIVATVALWFAEDRVEKAASKIRKGWLSAIEVALKTEAPSMPEISMDEARKNHNLITWGWVLWILKGILYIADFIFFALMLG